MKRVLDELHGKRDVYAKMLERDKSARAMGQKYTGALGPVISTYVRADLETHIKEIDAVVGKAEA